MLTRREGHFHAYQGTEIFYQSWTSESSRGTLVVVHGLAEHSECYNRFAQDMVPLGWDVYALDLRGHGRSEGKRGYIERFDYFSEDLREFIVYLKKEKKLQKPFALVGHSMGGLVTLRLLLDHGHQGAKAVCLSSPLLGISVPVPPLKEKAARFLLKVLPQITLANEIRYPQLVRDQEWIKTYEADAMRHDKISPALYFGMVENIAYVGTRGSEIEIPILVQAAGDERIVSRPAIEQFFPTIGSKNKKLIIYEGSYHEIYNDLDRMQVLKELDAFLKANLV